MMEVLEEKEVDLDEGRETAALTAVAMFMNYEYRELRGEIGEEGKIRRNGNWVVFSRDWEWIMNWVEEIGCEDKRSV